MNGCIIIRPGCKNKCFFCGANVNGISSKNTIKEQEVGILKDIVDFRKKGYTSLDISGNDPIEYNKIISLVGYVKKIGFNDILINTHGRNLSDLEFTEKLIKAGVLRFRIPIYGSNAKVHDKVTGVKGSFKETIEGIKNIKRINPKANLILHTLVVRQNKNDLIKILKKSKKLGFDNFGIGMLHIANGDYSNYVPYKSVGRYVKPFYSFAIKNNIKGINFFDMPHCIFGELNEMIILSITPDLGKYSQIPENVKSNIRNLPSYRLKTKVEICEECKLSDKCDGFLINDISKYGIGKLKPII